MFVQSAQQEHTLLLQLKLPVLLAQAPLGALQAHPNAQLVKHAQLGHIIAWSVLLLLRGSALTVLLVHTHLLVIRVPAPIVATESTLPKVPIVAKPVQLVSQGITSVPIAPMEQTHSAQSAMLVITQLVPMNMAAPYVLSRLTGAVRERQNVTLALNVNQATINPVIVQ